MVKKCQAIGKTTNKPCPWNAQEGKNYCKKHEPSNIIDDNKTSTEESNKIFFWKRKSTWYALLYFLCVPIFAVIYYLIPDQFYHSTTKYEPEYFELATNLSNQMVREFEEFGNLEPPYLEEETLEYDAPKIYGYEQIIGTKGKLISVGNFEVSGNRLKMDLLIEVTQTFKEKVQVGRTIKTKNFSPSFHIHPTINFDVFWNNNFFWYDGTPKKLLDSMLIDIGTISEDNPLILPTKRVVVFDIEKFKNGNFQVLPDYPSINLQDLLFHKGKNTVQEEFSFYASDDTYKKILMNFAVLKGFPVKLEGSFNRFLYLSATTITTLGLGDIYPLTSCARIIITIETLLGILLMGLFLNAIAKENSLL